MKQVAKLAGTSQPTVSDVLGGRAKTKGIKDTTAERVRKAAKQLGYRPNWLAQSLVRGSTGVIGVHFPTYGGGHHGRLIRAVDVEAQARGYHIILSPPTLWDREKSETLRLLDHGLDGLIVYPLVERKMAPTLSKLKREGLAISLIAASQPEDVPSVVDDNVSAAEQAVEHLIKLGHRRIGFVGRSNATRDNRERRQGYRRTMDAAGLERRSEWIIRCVQPYESTFAYIRKRLDIPNRPTAYYCTDDTLAVCMQVVARDLGLSVPDDLALVGHGDDLPFAVDSLIGLTTVVQDTTAIANLAITAVVDQLQGKQPELISRVRGRLLVRRSCGAATSESTTDRTAAIEQE